MSHEQRGGSSGILPAVKSRRSLSWWHLAMGWPAPIIVALLVHKCSVDRATIEREVAIQAVITEKPPNAHGAFRYRFVVDDKGYTGLTSTFENHVGEKVRVYYDPLDPTRSEQLGFAHAWRRDIKTIWVVALVACVGVPLIVLLGRWLWAAHPK